MRYFLTVLVFSFSLLLVGQTDPHFNEGECKDTASIKLSDDGFLPVQDTFNVNPLKHFVLRSKTEGIIVLRWTPVVEDSTTYILKSFYTNLTDEEYIENMYREGYELFIKKETKVNIKKSKMGSQTENIGYATLTGIFMVFMVFMIWSLDRNRKFIALKNALNVEVEMLNEILPNVKGNRKGKPHQKMQLGYWKNCAVNARASIDRLSKYL